MTITQLKELISENPNTMKQIMYQASNIKGSKAYWNARSHELQDMVEQIGLPTVFITLSCADGHWEDLYKLMTHKDILSLSPRERRQLVQDNPHIVDAFFDYRVNVLINKLLQTHFKVTDYWYRVEYQHRGSPHIHGVFWFENAPDVSNIENQSEEYIAEVINYFSKLIEAWNPLINPLQSDTHPCRKNYQNVENFEQDLAQLLHMVQRHVCSNDYCHRINSKTKKRECRFKFPQDMQESASINKNDRNETEFKPRRNDPYLNKFNAFLIQLWRANMDIAPVISKRALLAYLAKYISKSEIQSKSLREIFGILIDSLNGDLAAKKLIHKVFMKSCAERDISAQEVCHSLLRLKLHSAGGRQFVIVNLAEKKWVQVEDDESFENVKHGKSVVEKYKDRANRLEDISLWNFAKNFDMIRFSKVKKFNIVRVFPKLKLTDDPTKNEDFYKQQVILHVPWRDESKLKKIEETWLNVYDTHNIKQICNSITIVSDDSNSISEEEYDSSDTDSECEENNILEELLSSRLGPTSKIPQINLGNREVDRAYNWYDSFEKYKQYGTIVDFENYIDNMKSKKTDVNVETELPDIILTTEQQHIVNIIKRHIHIIKTKNECHDNIQLHKRIIVQGKAALLNKELGRNSYLLATPTGVTAVLINGKTLHSIFKLPRKTSEYTSLKGERARDMTNVMKEVKCLILDEFSMIGCSTLAMINKRCKEALGSNDDFGGLIVIMLGDIKQLPPVKDSPFYSKNQKSLMSKEGKVLINNFDKVYILQKSHRQADDDEYLRVIDNVSELHVSQSDYKYLSLRFTNNVSQEEKDKFKDTIRLFSTKDEVKQYNMVKLSELHDIVTGAPTPILKLPAKHNCSEAKQGSTDSAEGLETKLFLAKGCKIMLPANIWIEKNLCNGTIGCVEDILYNPASEQPAVILCNFPTYKGLSIIPGTTLIPIKPILKSWTDANGVNCSRYQFPVTLCYACSIHKSQGMTLDKAVINLGEVEFSMGLSYVAISRVRCSKDILIIPFTHKRLMPSPKTVATLEMRKDFINTLSAKI
ncbi:ATP-dependent DNA helicase [Frankliniella fusca]|uniref:ATP-dependent DNA helicase n=1 Tax=Frankliniella fusca TaxID=407009 RepID=A0AAE1LU71_9NEOP|nr:ATP-dependent DNA helicase [Frankliniella fusca]